MVAVVLTHAFRMVEVPAEQFCVEWGTGGGRDWCELVTATWGR